MRPQRLSFEAAGARLAPRADAPAAPHRTPVPRTAGLGSPPPYGRSPAQARPRRVAIATLLVVHGVALLGLLNASRLREQVAEARPVFVAVVDTPAPVAPPRPLPLPPLAKMTPPPLLDLPLVAPDMTPAPSPMVARSLPPAPPPALPAPAEAPPAPAPSILPRTIPPSAVQYLVPPAPVYSRISAKMRESGQAVVRVYIDEAGLPRNVQLAASTGFGRLDDAALAAVRNCRFKPYLDNGVPVAGWASIPIEFELPT